MCVTEVCANTRTEKRFAGRREAPLRGDYESSIITRVQSLVNILYANEPIGTQHFGPDLGLRNCTIIQLRGTSNHLVPSTAAVDCSLLYDTNSLLPTLSHWLAERYLNNHLT